MLMTLLALFFWYHINWIQQRQHERAKYERYLAEKPELIGTGRVVVGASLADLMADANDRLPLMLKLFGEPPQFAIEKFWEYDDAAGLQAESDRLQSLFPEALIHVHTSRGGNAFEGFQLNRRTRHSVLR